MNLLSPLLPPPRQWTDSLFRSQARRIAWGGSWSMLRTRTLFWALHAFIILIGSWLIFALIQWSMMQGGARLEPRWLLTFTQGFWLLAVGLSVAAALPLDFAAMTAGIGAISAEITSRRYDLIRLTLRRPLDVVVTQYALAHVKAWRDTARLMWARALLVLFGALIVAWDGFASESTRLFVSPDALSGTFALAVAAMIAAVFVLEPYWRMKAVTALGVALSARLFNGMSVALASGLSVLAFWFVQLLGVAALSFFVPFSLVFLSMGSGLLLLPLAVLLFGAVIYGFYALVQHISLRHAAIRLTLLEFA